MSSVINQEFHTILEETFTQHHGMYTDKGTSLFETLGRIDHIMASRKVEGINETIAGHVYHIDYYIHTLVGYITKTITGKTDWNLSWKIKEVTEKEWDEIRKGLELAYNELENLLRSISNWEEEDNIGGMLAISCHCAYHLGAIRQIMEMK